jgi:hypothetical protein
MTDMLEPVSNHLPQDARFGQELQELWLRIDAAYDKDGADGVTRAIKRAMEERKASFSQVAEQVRKLL